MAIADVYVEPNGTLVLRFHDKARAIGGRPTQGTFGIHDAQILAPGDPYRSVLYFRLAKTGPGHMPHLGELTAWLIGSKKAHVDLAKAGVAYVSSTNAKKGRGTLLWLVTPEWLER